MVVKFRVGLPKFQNCVRISGCTRTYNAQNVFQLYVCLHNNVKKEYCKVASSRLSWLVALPRPVKGKFDVLWPLTKKFQNSIVDQSTEVRFASFLFGGFITVIVVNPLEWKLADRNFVQSTACNFTVIVLCTGSQTNFQTKIHCWIIRWF